MKKKLLAGAITLLSVATLAACSTSSQGADLISMKGDVITEHQFFEEVKNNPTAQQVLLNMTIQKVFEKQYGSEVSDKDVDDAVAEEQKKYGDSYQTVLARAGMTAESRKQQIRTSKLVEYAVKKAAEAELTDENYKKAYDEYTPEVTAQIIKLDSEDKAKEVLAKAKESGADLVVNGKEVEDVAGYIQEKTGGTHSAVVTAVSKVAFNQAVDSVRAGGTVVAVGLPSEYMELSIVKTVLDGIRVVGSLVGTRKDLEEAFDFGAQGLVVPVVETVPVDTAVEVFDQMEKGEIQGRKVLDFTK